MPDTKVIYSIESEYLQGPLQQPDWVESLQQILNSDVHRRLRDEARARYSPQLSYGRHLAPPGPSARSAAVMILLEVAQPTTHWQESCLPLTVRPPYLADHPGQISLPGGRLEKGETALEAATREFCEELGVSEFPGTIVGSLSPMWVFHSDYYLVPFLAVHCGTLDYTPCSREVARLFHLPVVELLKVNQPTVQEYSRGNVSWKAGVFTYQQECIWGATAMILAELASVLRLMGE